MNSQGPLPAVDAEEEIAALIGVLHDTERRLEVLTAGEVDTVAGGDGRTFVLQHAQEYLRVSNAARQSAILNALPAHTALLDAEGRIVSVNDAWRHFVFAEPGAMYGVAQPVGLDYLDLCERAPAGGTSEARRFAAGLRCVLGGSEPGYSIEYPCHTPVQKRWFLVSVAPLADDPPAGVVIMRMDISERRRGEATLHSFRSAMDETAEAIVLVSRETLRYVEVNATACRMYGYTREELLQRGPWELTGGTQKDLAHDYDGIIAAEGENRPIETKIRRKDGTMLDVEAHRHALPSGADWIIVGVVRDITERKLAEEVRIKRVLELERFHRLSVGREMQMIDLKKQVNALAIQAGVPAPYDLAFLDRGGPDRLVPP